MIIAGDFNNYENFNLDCTGGSFNVFNQKRSEIEVLNDMKVNYGYVDSYRVLHPHGKLFTYTSRITGNYRARLDRIYLHNYYCALLISTDIIPISFSDHDMYAITLDLKNDGTDRKVWGKGLWKYNSKLFSKKENLNILQEKWFEWRTKKSEYVDLIGWWEEGKQNVIKKICRELGKKRKEIKMRERTI